MFEAGTVTTAIAILAALSISGLAYALLSPLMEREDRKERINKVAVVDRRAAHARIATEEDAASRRKNIANKLKQQQSVIDEKTKKSASSRAPLEMRIKRAGLNWSIRHFWIVSIISGLGMYGTLYGMGAPMYAALAAGAVGLLALPSWYVNFKAASRMKKFLNEFPNAIDVIVRGMKSGLPLNDCMMIISREAAEPVRSEFKIMVEQQQLGLPLNEAVVKMHERVPLPEVNFLSIMMAIQGQSGGNLSEPLGNLSRVVRDRRKMKAKIEAMSMEAKSSAGIIACLPVAVIIALYLTTPDYMTLLFTERVGNILLGVCVLLMFTGVMVMRKMINFDI